MVNLKPVPFVTVGDSASLCGLYLVNNMQKWSCVGRLTLGANLDQLYRSWRESFSNDSFNTLIMEIRKLSARISKSEDVAQIVCIHIIRNIGAFDALEQNSFTKWVRAVIRRISLEARRNDLKLTDMDEYVDESFAPQEDHHFTYIEDLPSDIRQVAESLISGYSIKETAERLEVRPGTLRTRLLRFRQRSCDVLPSPEHMYIEGQICTGKAAPLALIQLQ
jgi:RNA polymerase sigma factor (sigma-70 family)